MGVLYSPKIVTDGLVLALDAANPKSYPGSGTTWTDLSGNENNGTLTNGPTFDSGNGGSISFDGVDDRITFSYAPSFFTNYTIECFFNGTSFNAGEGLVSWGENVTSKRRGLILWNGGHTSYWTVRSSTFGSNPEGSTAIDTNKWYHAAVALNNEGLAKIYVNGINDGEGTNTLATPSTNTLYVGDTGYPEPFNGKIAMVRIYNRALTPEEILQNYNATKSRYNL